MNIKINRFLLTQTSWDSGSLTPLASVLHRFKEPGSYRGIVYRGKEQVGLFDLLVDEKAHNAQLNIDLEAVTQRGFAATGNANVFKANPHQPVLFYVPRGRGGYSVAVFKTNIRRKAAVFNNFKLEDGDLFTVTPNRSGNYSVTNQDKAKGEISVQKRKGQAVPTEPVIIDVKHGAFKPAKVKAEFMQPIFFHIRTASQIKVQLNEQKDKIEGTKPGKKESVRKKKKKLPLKR